MKKYVLTVTLNPAVDTLIVDNSSELKSAGGKGVNVARALKCLDNNVLATGILGGENGKRIIQLLTKERIKNDFYIIQSETRENVTFLSKNGKITRRKIGRGTRISDSQIKGFISHYKKLLHYAKCVVLSGRKPFGVNDDIYEKLIKYAYQYSVAVVLDTSGAALKQALKAKPTIIKPNLEELESCCRTKLDSQVKIKNAILRFHAKGIVNVLVSLGKNGSIGSNGKQTLFVKPPIVKVKNDLGCGDVFVAGYVSEFLKGNDFKESLCMATATATESARNIIPGLTGQKNVIQLLKTISVKEL